MTKPHESHGASPHPERIKKAMDVGDEHDDWVAPDRAALERLAAATRSVVEEVRRSAAPVDVLDGATAALDQIRSQLAPYAWPGPYAQSTLRISTPMKFEGTKPEELFPYSPIIGPRNPVAPPVTMIERDGGVEGVANFGPAYSGPPGFVHGGIIALVFDELLGVTTVLGGAGGMTGTLTISYRAPTPLQTEVTLVGRVTGREGRKILARGELRVGDQMTAEAEGIFIQPRQPMIGEAPQPR